MIPSAISVAFDYWSLGDEMCKFHAFFNYMFAYSSSVNLTVISIDRAMAIAYPFKYQAKMTARVMTKMCAFVFILSFVVGWACAGTNWTSFNYSEAACAMEYTTILEVYYVFTTCCFTCYYMPVALLSVSNTITVESAKWNSRFAPKEYSNKLDIPLSGFTMTCSIMFQSTAKVNLIQ